VEIKLYTPEQIWKILQLNQLTILKYIREKKLHAVKFWRIYRISEEALMVFINKNKI
jgi:excisionase family DNA binding protein